MLRLTSNKILDLESQIVAQICLLDFVEMYSLLEAYILKYRYSHTLIYSVFAVCLVPMQVH
jgi:hypothetical protein